MCNVFRRSKAAVAMVPLAALVLFACQPSRPEGTPKPGLARSCGAGELFDLRMATDPAYRARFDELERVTQDWIQRFRKSEGEALRTNVATIPVVVHVLWNDATENITDAQIQSQLVVLNEDYRAANADISTVPTEFQPLIGDTRIEFALAVRDPNCGPTNGITRTEVTKTFYTLADEDAKSAAAGGVDPWPTDRYLNMWIVPDVRDSLGNSLLGYSSFPADPPELQGVVMPHNFFGTTGTVAAPFHLGRTTSHELGHFFNLRHIFADDQNTADPCSGSDFVDDTPNCAGPNFDCPMFPSVSCNNAPDGDMFMNYMDYVDDPCMVMLSQGQVERMAAALYTSHTGLLGSDGLIPPPPTAVADLFAQDETDDVGDEPNTTSTRFYRSQDIWVRRQQDGLTNQEHETPIFRPSGPSHFVYVRVRNRGCADADPATLRLYWAKASTGLSWPSPWDGSVTSPALMGDSIGSQSTGSISGGGFTVLEFAWDPPNPADYASFGADKTHFCLLARIETDATDPFGMTFPEGANLSANVRDNNNIVWKNVSILEEDSGGSRKAQVMAANYEGQAMKAAFAFDRPKPGEASLFDAGRVVLELDSKLYQRWLDGGKEGAAFEDLGGGRVELVRPSGYLAGIELAPKELFVLGVEVLPQPKLVPYAEIYEGDLLQYDGVPGSGRLIGGQHLVWKKP